MKKAILLLSAILPLAGCMTSGTNLHGDFTCRAPNGTCAPMSAIDAKAVADIGIGPQSIGGQDLVTIPSGGRMLTVAAADAQAAVVPARTGERVLKVVFPAHIDASGVYHDEASAHAVVERPAWTADLTGSASATLAASASVPTAGALASLDAVIAARAAGAAGTTSMPSPAATGPSPAAGFTPSAWAAPSRAAAPLNLREAIAGTGAGTVAGLDGASADTPDVTAALSSLPAAGTRSGFKTVRWHGRLVRVAIRQPVSEPAERDAGDPPGQGSDAVASAGARDAVVGPVTYRTVRWHGRAYRIPVKHPQSATPVAAAAVSTSGARALNLAALDRGRPADAALPTPKSAATGSEAMLGGSSATPGYSSRPLSDRALASSAPPSPAKGDQAPPAAAASNLTAPPAGLAPVFAPTADAALAAKRVRLMAAPVIRHGIIDGRAAASAETQSLGNPFTALTGTSSVASTVYGPDRAAASIDGEPRR